MSNPNCRSNMRPMLVEKDETNSVPHWLYDLSIENIEERKEKRQYFESGAAIANFIGVPPKDIWDKRIPGRKIFSKKFNRWYTIRVAHDKE